MIIKSIQKVIKVGSSLAVTIPTKDAKYYGVQAGREVEVSIRPRPTGVASPKTSLDSEYQAFKAQYGQTLKNLKDR